MCGASFPPPAPRLTCADVANVENLYTLDFADYVALTDPCPPSKQDGRLCAACNRDVLDTRRSRESEHRELEREQYWATVDEEAAAGREHRDAVREHQFRAEHNYDLRTQEPPDD